MMTMTPKVPRSPNLPAPVGARTPGATPIFPASGHEPAPCPAAATKAPGGPERSGGGAKRLAFGAGDGHDSPLSPEAGKPSRYGTTPALDTPDRILPEPAQRLKTIVSTPVQKLGPTSPQQQKGLHNFTSRQHHGKRTESIGPAPELRTTTRL